MNHSGVALKLLKNKFNTNIENIIVIHDDLDLKSGVMKFKSRWRTWRSQWFEEHF